MPTTDPTAELTPTQPHDDTTQPASTVAQPRYRLVNRDYLLSLEGKIDFNLYARMTSDPTVPPVLLLPRGTSLATLRQALTGKGHSALCVNETEYSRYWQIIERSLQEMLHDSTIPIQRKASLLYTCARDTMETVFADPRSGENIAKTRMVTDSIIQLAVLDQTAIPCLLRLSSYNYRTFSHCVNVTVFAVGLQLTISHGDERELRELAHGCILHDIGKAAIDQQILEKPGTLTDREFAIVREHPRLGYRLMKDRLSELALDIILHHHEKIDGLGYPDGLAGDAISNPVKICAIADVYDALTSNRPYASARAPYDALLLMKEEMVGHFEQQKFLDFIRLLGHVKDDGAG